MTVGAGKLWRVVLRARNDNRIVGRVQVAAVSKLDAIDITSEWLNSQPLSAGLNRATAFRPTSGDITVRKAVSPDDPFLVRYPTTPQEASRIVNGALIEAARPDPFPNLHNCETDH